MLILGLIGSAIISIATALVFNNDGFTITDSKNFLAVKENQGIINYYTQPESLGNRSTIEKQLEFVLDYLDILNKTIRSQTSSIDTSDLSELRTRSSIVEKLLQAMEDKQYDQVYDFSNKLINLDSTDWPAYVMRGIALSELGNSRDALDDFNYAIENSMSNSLLYSLRASSHMDLGEYDFALSNYTKSLEIDDDPITRFNQGNAYLNLEMYDEAIETYQMVIEQEPSDSAMINQGIAYRSIGEFDIALEKFKTVLTIFPTHDVALGQIIATNHELGRDEESLPILEKAISEDPENVALWFMKSLVLETLYEKEQQKNKVSVDNFDEDK